MYKKGFSAQYLLSLKLDNEKEEYLALFDIEIIIEDLIVQKNKLQEEEQKRWYVMLEKKHLYYTDPRYNTAYFDIGKESAGYFNAFKYWRQIQDEMLVIDNIIAKILTVHKNSKK